MVRAISASTVEAAPVSAETQETAHSTGRGLLPSAPASHACEHSSGWYVLTITDSEQTAMEQYSLFGEGMDSQRTRQDQDLCLEAGIVHVPFEVSTSISILLSSYVVTMMEFKIPCGSAPSSLVTCSSILYFTIFTTMDKSNNCKLSARCSLQ